MSLAEPRTLVYQVFVDRFAGDGGAPLAAPPASAGDPWRVHAGGTLGGIEARLDHIASLGADALYLTPIFHAPSNHKYDTADFDRVDARFGGDAAFARLAAACRSRGMGLILDGVFNHVGEEHAWFRGARADAADPRAAWFRFAEHPHRYDAWRGFGNLPELALERDDVVAALLAVVGRWLERGATGFRLDCANDLGVRVCARTAHTAREAGAADGVIGEVMAWAEDFVADGVLDGVMNYWLRESLLGLARGEVPAVQVAHNLAEQARRYRADGLRRSWNMLASHDTARLASAVPDAAARSCARALAFLAPGVPHLYYGDEIGMTGAGDPDNRGPMVWDEARWDRAALAEIRALAALRRERRALRDGDMIPLAQPGSPAVLCFARTTGRAEETIVVVANAQATPVRARLFLAVPQLHDGMPMRDVRGAAPPAKMAAGTLTVELAPWQVAAYMPDDETIAGYRFLGRG